MTPPKIGVKTVENVIKTKFLMQCDTLKGQFLLQINLFLSLYSTEVVPCTDEDEMSKIPTIQFDFCKISQLDASLKDTTVDIIGVVKSAADCVNITSSRTQKELKKRDLILVDKSLTGKTIFYFTSISLDGDY